MCAVFNYFQQLCILCVDPQQFQVCFPWSRRPPTTGSDRRRHTGGSGGMDGDQRDDHEGDHAQVPGDQALDSRGANSRKFGVRPSPPRESQAATNGRKAGPGGRVLKPLPDSESKKELSDAIKHYGSSPYLPAIRAQGDTEKEREMQREIAWERERREAEKDPLFQLHSLNLLEKYGNIERKIRSNPIRMPYSPGNISSPPEQKWPPINPFSEEVVKRTNSSQTDHETWWSMRVGFAVFSVIHSVPLAS